MKKPLGIATVVAAVVGLLSVSPLAAQRPAAAPEARPGLALVDMATVVQKSARLKQAMDKLKAEYEADAAILRKEGEQGNKMTEEFRKLAPNDPNRKKMEDDLVRMRTDFEIHGKRVTDKVRDQETKVFLSLSKELGEELARYAQATGVQVVLRNDPPAPEMNDPRAILQEIQKPIVYQRGVDATTVVLEALNRRVPAAPAATARQPAQGAARPVQK